MILMLNLLILMIIVKMIQKKGMIKVTTLNQSKIILTFIIKKIYRLSIG